MGDLIEVHKDEEIPADLLLLYAEDHSGEAVDLVFVDTINLDGESNLKPRMIIDSELKTLKEIETQLSRSYMKYESPNKNLLKWEGTFHQGSKELKGSIDNLLLRGCTLRNTCKAYGVVIYIGKHTKIVMNARTV